MASRENALRKYQMVVALLSQFGPGACGIAWMALPCAAVRPDYRVIDGLTRLLLRAILRL